MSDRIGSFARYLKEQQRVDDKTCAFVVEWATMMMEHCRAMERHMKAMEEFRVLSPKAEADLTNRLVDTVDRRLHDAEVLLPTRRNRRADIAAVGALAAIAAVALAIWWITH